MRYGCGGLVWMATVLALGACANSTVEYADFGSATGGAGSGVTPDGAALGDDCSGSTPCRSGLVCENGTCVTNQSAAEGEDCIISQECVSGHQCVGGVCVPAADGAEGDSCVTDADCGAELRCGIVRLTLQCVPEGTGDLGAECATATDCYAGLTCVDNECQPAPPGVPTFGVPTFNELECGESSDSDAPTEAYFEVPGTAEADSGEFFRLPFPNDIRLTDGRPDLDGFPTTGPGLLGQDIVAEYVAAIEGNEGGWSAYPTVFFRFSAGIDFDSFRPGMGVPPKWIDITPDAASYNANAGNRYSWSPQTASYICPNWLAVRRPVGNPLQPGHTYAVWLGTEDQDEDGNPLYARDENGEAFTRSSQLEAMLTDQTPADPVLAAAHARYQVFRDYLNDPNVNPPHPSSILNVAVFTVGGTRDPMADISTAVEAAIIPNASQWTRCTATTTSPCAQAGGDRACGSGTADYEEYHALVRLPIFQTGEAPYETSGGAIDVSNGPVRQENVCMSLTVPTGSMPAEGWPLVVYAHGTGGSFRSHVRSEVAGALSGANTPGGTVRFAVLGIDQVVHGPRRGDSDASPDDLFANFQNPDAARGNILQGAADQLALARFAAGLDVSAGETGGNAIRINPDAIVFYGHSQGATHGSLALPYTNTYKAAVLSGNGASLMDSLRTKSSPVDIGTALAFLLGDMTPDGNLPGDDMHPVLALLQHWMDPADPLHFARIIGQDPLDGMLSTHVLQTYGIGDTYSPPITLRTFVFAGGLQLAQADSSVTTPDAIGTMQELRLPVAGNVTVDGLPTTLVVREYQPPADQDGHFVSTSVPGARADIARFLGMAARGEVPQVGE